jgi:hypothetical protein
MKLKCADLLIEKYLEWQQDLGQVRTLKNFAEHLEIHEVTLNQLINGKKSCTPKMCVHLAKKTGDTRFYDLADLPHPDPGLQEITRLWSSLSEFARTAILEQVEDYAARDEPKTQPLPEPSEVA